MAENYVQLFGQWSDGGTKYASGNWLITAAGQLADSSSIGLVVGWMAGQLDKLGSLSVVGQAGNSGLPILASDNFTPGYLTYDVKLWVGGMMHTDARGVAINYSDGASQFLNDVLSAAGYVQPVMP